MHYYRKSVSNSTRLQTPTTTVVVHWLFDLVLRVICVLSPERHDLIHLHLSCMCE